MIASLCSCEALFVADNQHYIAREKEMKSLWKRCGAVICAVTVAVSLAGCGVAETQTGAETVSGSSEEKKTQIGIVFDSFVIERWERDRDIFVSTAKDLGADVIVGNANGDPEEQKNIISHMIDSNVSVLVVVATDADGLTSSVEEAHKAGIPVISYDRIIRNAGTDLYLTFDNEKVGTYMAETINEALPDGGSYMKVNGSDMDNNVLLVNDGFDKTINSNIAKIDEISCDNWNDGEAYDYLTEHPEDVENADAFMCGNDAIAGQVVRVLSENRKAGKVVVTGQDADLEACQRIAEGTQAMTVYKPIEDLATKAAQYAVQIAKGSMPKISNTISDGTYDVPYIDINPAKVTADNLDQVIVDSGFHTREDVYLHLEDRDVTDSSQEMEEELVAGSASS